MYNNQCNFVTSKNTAVVVLGDEVGEEGEVCLAIRGCFIAIFAHTRLKASWFIGVLLKLTMLN